jgi:hypothetical protein
MKKLSDILLEAQTVVEEIGENSNTIVPPVTSMTADRVGAALEKLDQIGEMSNDLYNTLSHLEEIDAETDAALTGAYNCIDDVYAKIDDKYDVIPVDLEEYDLEEDLELCTDVEIIVEKLSPDAPASEWIDDFIKSDAPQFKGKTKKERIKMALGAYYGAQQNEDVKLNESDYPSQFPKDVSLVKASAKDRKHGLATYGYHSGRKSLYVNAVISGDVYVYHNVPSSVWNAMNDSENVGEFYKNNIKGKFKSRRINEDLDLEEAADSSVLGLIKKAGFVDMPLRDGPFPAPHAAKKWGIKMRAGKWADTVVGQYKSDSLHPWFIYANDELRKYGSDEMFVKALKKMVLGEELDEAVELEEGNSFGGSLRSLGFINMTDAEVKKAYYKWASKIKPGFMGWEQPMGKYAVGFGKDGRFFVVNKRNPSEIDFYTGEKAALAAVRNLKEESNLEESVNLPKIKELVSLALIDEKDVPATIAALKATQSDKALTPAQTKLLGNLAVMLTNVILGDTSALSSVKRAAKE